MKAATVARLARHRALADVTPVRRKQGHSLAHQGVTTALRTQEVGDSFDKFCARQISRAGYRGRSILGRYRKRMTELGEEYPQMELRGTCGSDAHLKGDE